jgi:hypothetical protein
MLGIADDYERLAQRAQERAAGRPQPRQLLDPGDCPRIGCNGLHQAGRALLCIVRQVDVKGGRHLSNSRGVAVCHQPYRRQRRLV